MARKKPKRARTVELRPAFSWTCEDCGMDHFERSMLLEGPTTKETIVIAGEKFEVERVRRKWRTATEQVQCSHCGAEFTAREMM